MNDLFCRRKFREYLSLLVLILVFPVIVFFSEAVFAAEGANPGGDSGDAGSTCNSSNNALEGLCEEGKKGGGASWRFYKADEDDIIVPAYERKGKANLTDKAHIAGCKSAGWYLRYGYEKLKYGNKYGKNFNEQIGVLSITGNKKSKNDWISSKLGSSTHRKRQFNDFGAESIKENSDGTIDLSSLKDKAENSSGNGVKITWESAKLLFDKMKEYDTDNKYNTKDYSMEEKTTDVPGLGYFCFSPKSILANGEFGSKSSVEATTSSGSGFVRQYTDLNGKKNLTPIKLKKGGSVTLDFEHYILAGFDPSTKTFDHKATIKDNSGGGDSKVNFSDKSPRWKEADGTDTTNMWKTDPPLRHRTKSSFEVKHSAGGSAKTYCQSIGEFPKELGKADLFKEDNSKICVRIEMEKDTPPPTGTCFRDGVIDASDDKGNNAIWSYVRNNNKSDGTGFPDPTAGHSDNSALSAGLRETEVVGGNKGVDNSTVSIFAKPLDRIQFRHVFCFGAQAVKSLSLKDAKAGKSRGYHTPESAFGLSGDNGPIYDRAISGGQISFKSGEDGKVKSPDSPVRSEQWGRAYDDSRSGGHSVEVDNTGNTISEKVTIGSNSKAWVGGSIERSFKWDKPLSDDKTEFTDGSDDEMHKGPPSACGCNATDNASKIIPSNVYGDLVDLDPVNGLEYKKCKQNGECDKKCKPLPPASGVPSSPPQYPRDCDLEGNCKFSNFEEDKDNAYKLFPLNTGDGSGTTTTQVKVPYNFNTEMKSAPTFTGSGVYEDGGVVFAGEPVSAKGKISILRRENPVVSSEDLGHGDKKYATKTPEMKIRTLAFTIKPGTAYDDSGINGLSGQTIKANDISVWDLPPAISGVAERSIFEATGKVFNDNGSPLPGSVDEDFDLNDLVVPDVATGTKLCVIAAVYPADSHGLPDQEISDNNDQAVAMQDQIMNGKSWRLSPPACRTIAKKPSTQVWNGGIISGGSITGAPAHKIEGKLGENKIETVSGSPNRHSFGSWSEYELIAQGKISGFGSGAAMGYVSTATSRFALPGGIVVGPSDPFACAISNLTIANSPADKACDDSTAIGESGITIDATIRERLEGRYRNLAEKSSSDTIQQGYTCTYDSATNKYIDRDTSQTCANNGTRYFGNTNITINTGNISTPFILGATSDTSSNKNTNNTMVIDAENNVHIESNIYYENTDYKNIASIPQLLIFAKNIHIDANVKNIDAWLIADNIYTCTQGLKKSDTGGIPENPAVYPSIEAATEEHSAGGNSICGKQLTINGPVFAGNLSLLRHAGAYPGGGSRKPGFNPANPVPDLLSDGSVTPAEIFNLRLDAYLWAYSQAERLTQAFVTYSRELPPRY